MSETRVYLEAPLASNQSLTLPESAFRHLVQVLRMQAGDALIVFDGCGGEYSAVIESVAKRGATIAVGQFHDVSRESPLSVTLVQGISKGDRMDWTLQKAVELGVSAVVPVVTERCNVSLDPERQDKKLDHWRGVMISACEQSGRTRVPLLHPVQRLAQWLAQPSDTIRVMLDPEGEAGLADLQLADAALSLIIGPEGGLSANERALVASAGGLRARLGPRVLRTETAGVVALAVLQARAGDLRG